MSRSPTSNNENGQPEARQVWDRAAASFDDEPDHGLHPAHVLQAWTELLRAWLPAPEAAVLDVGCGTGSLSLVLAGLGHQVVGIDFSPAMIARAQAKANAAGQAIEFHVMDAAAPALLPASFEALVSRHLLWALPDPAQALGRWASLLKPGGRLILIEGYWSTGAGLHAAGIAATLPVSVATVSIQNLSDRPDLWGKPVTDERYAVIADLVVE
jgi:2-polyprenyl-3-methyl-5-hydroxy-6-metoxy-1,4-benzoquinol methylase